MPRPKGCSKWEQAPGPPLTLQVAQGVFYQKDGEQVNWKIYEIRSTVVNAKKKIKREGDLQIEGWSETGSVRR